MQRVDTAASSSGRIAFGDAYEPPMSMYGGIAEWGSDAARFTADLLGDLRRDLHGIRDPVRGVERQCCTVTTLR